MIRLIVNQLQIIDLNQYFYYSLAFSEKQGERINNASDVVFFAFHGKYMCF